MEKIGFIVPWFSDNIKGGAEMELKELVHHLQNAGVKLEVLTTCVKDFLSDWNKNYYKEATTVENGIVTKRFKIKERNVVRFDEINARLIANQKVSEDEEKAYMENMIHSPNLYKYMDDNKDEYSLFVFIPYMFGTTYEGLKVCPQKSILIPCLHNESYAYMKIYAERYSKIRGMIFHSKPESELANKIFDLSKINYSVLGGGVYTDISFNRDRFIEKYKINSPFMLYVGRKDATKNVDVLIKYFTAYKRRNKNNVKLVMIGPACLPIPDEMKNDIVDLGFVDLQDKYDAMSAATVLCQPSVNESFSLVIMESWLCERPVMVHNDCAVTKNFAIESNGGLYFENYYEFEKELNYFVQNPIYAEKIAQQGKTYVINNFAWDTIVSKYVEFFKQCIDNKDK